MRFHFTMAYRPGFHNTKADTLSRIYPEKDEPEEWEPILPKQYWVNAISREFDQELANTLPFHVLEECPTDRTYVPPRLQSKLITWAHTSPVSGHPGTKRTLNLLQSKYWWSSMARNVNQHVASCSICAQAKVPRHFPAGKLMPLASPQRPWSHITIDFITDLPESNRHTIILVVADRFSRGI